MSIRHSLIVALSNFTARKSTSAFNHDEDAKYHGSNANAFHRQLEQIILNVAETDLDTKNSVLFTLKSMTMGNLFVCFHRDSRIRCRRTPKRDSGVRSWVMTTAFCPGFLSDFGCLTLHKNVLSLHFIIFSTCDIVFQALHAAKIQHEMFRQFFCCKVRLTIADYNCFSL
jgi:hypothetical protein